jgi:hypothetical protein
MIEHGDFSRPGRIQVIAGERRVWWKPWRKHAVYRTIFLGFIESTSADSTGIRVEMIDALSRLRRGMA